MSGRLNLIVAVAPNNGIGYQGHLPWLIKKDMEHFRKLTQRKIFSGLKNAVVMGRMTWESIPSRFRPLKGRLNCVISKTMSNNNDTADLVQFYDSFQVCLEELFNKQKEKKLGEIFIIGGARLYEDAIKQETYPVRIFCTFVKKDFPADVFFPKVDWGVLKKVEDPEIFTEIQEDNGIPFQFQVFDL